ncbi:N-6 DNA methylase [Alteromonas stellipolaris]|uniref:N-6 DNA methylase n=1 Tax=Alteromonas stellipolaris TaxID=233316 RepID=UPI0026E3201B|nr:N-6 DNA methylase [Alteromonas stellipolaris]MDO6536260.1 N-6 DNA methylase [Alteromonas stellipolaris]MDO6627795.1 N-6 DNA methylase [Alteromonas stellipolaris]
MYSTSSASFTVPDEIAELGAGLIGQHSSVYCPFEKGVDFAFHVAEQSDVVCETGNYDDAFYAKVLSYFYRQNIKVKDSDPIESPSLIDSGKLIQFDSAIAMPPFGLNMKGKLSIDIWSRFPENSLMGEVYFLRHMLAQSSKQVVCFVSDAFLFRSTAGERHFKEDIFDNNWLEGVISLPTGLLSHKSTPINILILNKEKNHDFVRFYDARTDHFAEPISKTKNRLKNVKQIISEFQQFGLSDNAIDVPEDEIENNDYNLAPSRYVSSEKDREFHDFLSHFRKAPLRELVDFIRPQSLSHDECGEATFYEYGVNNLNDINLLSGKPRTLKVNKRKQKRADRHKIKPNDVLVVCRGAVGKVGFVPEDIEDNAVANQAFTILRIKEGCRRMTPQALFQYLSSEYGKYQLTSLATGTSSLMLSSNDIHSMTVPAFEKVQQEEIAVAHQQTVDIYKRIEVLQVEIANIQKDTFERMTL